MLRIKNRWYCCFRPRLILVSLLVLPSLAGADTPQTSNGDSDWQFELTPYLWGATMDVNSGTSGEGGSIDTDYEFFTLENLNGVASGTFNVKKGRWQLTLDGLYVSFKDEYARRFTDPELEIKGAIVEGNGGYKILPNRDLNVYAGARYYNIETTLQLLENRGKIRGQKSWVDPLVGLSFGMPLGERWYAAINGDVGGFGVSSDFALNAAVRIDYRISKTFTAKLGYRLLYVDFDRNNFVYDATLQGVQLGLGIRF